MIAYKTPHWIDVKRILRHLYDTFDYGLDFKCSTKVLVNAFTDDRVSCLDDRPLTFGIYDFLGANLVIWSTRK